MSGTDEAITLSSALFQASIWLERTYPEGSMERLIADVCWQAHEAIEDYVGLKPKDLECRDQGCS
jgi:hypothetical protein